MDVDVIVCGGNVDVVVTVVMLKAVDVWVIVNGGIVIVDGGMITVVAGSVTVAVIVLLIVFVCVTVIGHGG